MSAMKLFAEALLLLGVPVTSRLLGTRSLSARQRQSNSSALVVDESFEEGFDEWDDDADTWGAGGSTAEVPRNGTAVIAALSVAVEQPWPRVLILGAQKAATSSLWALLRTHPQLCAGRHLPGEAGYRGKEVHYFDLDYSLGAGHYLKHFTDGRCKQGKGMFMDATPSYLRTPEAPARVWQTVPRNLHAELRLIAVLREPMGRDLSFYNHDKYLNNYHGHVRPTAWVRGLDESYEDYAHRQLAYAGAGRPNAFSYGAYDAQLTHWTAKFPRRQLLVLSFTDLIRKQQPTFLRVAGFLGVSSSPLSGRPLPHTNAPAFAKKVHMHMVSCQVREEVARFFEPLNAKLYSSLDASRESHQAPEEEPPFLHFKPSTC